MDVAEVSRVDGLLADLSARFTGLPIDRVSEDHAKGVSFVGASPFIRLLLGIETSRPPPSDGPTPRESKT